MIPAAIPKPVRPSSKRIWREAETLEKLLKRVPSAHHEAIRFQITVLREPMTVSHIRETMKSVYAQEYGERALDWKDGDSETEPSREWLELI